MKAVEIETNCCIVVMSLTVSSVFTIYKRKHALCFRAPRNAFRDLESPNNTLHAPGLHDVMGEIFTRLSFSVCVHLT